MATTNGDSHGEELITGLAHVNLIIPRGTLDTAKEFYGETLGLRSRPVVRSLESEGLPRLRG